MGAFEEAQKPLSFKTGEQLRKLSSQRLMETNAKNAAAAGRAGGAQSRVIGSNIATGLMNLFGNKEPAGVASGDILANMEKAPETAAEFADLQKQLFAAGLEEDGLALTGKIKGLQEVEKGFKDGSKATKPITSDDDRTMAVDLIRSRSDMDDTLVGGSLAPMFSEDASPAQKGQAAFFRSAMAEKASTIQQQLIDRGIDGVDKALIMNGLLDELENTPGVIQEDNSFLWFGEKAGVDTKALTGTLDKIGQNYIRSMESGMSGDSKPVKPAPASPTTQMDAPPQTQDIKGKVDDAGMGTPKGQKLADDPKVQQQVDTIGKQKDMHLAKLEEMKAAGADSKSLKQMEGIIDALSKAQDKLLK